MGRRGPIYRTRDVLVINRKDGEHEETFQQTFEKRCFSYTTIRSSEAMVERKGHSTHYPRKRKQRRHNHVLVRFGIATAEEVGVDTYAGRVRAEVVSQHSYVVLPLMVRAWTRKDS